MDDQKIPGYRQLSDSHDAGVPKEVLDRVSVGGGRPSSYPDVFLFISKNRQIWGKNIGPTMGERLKNILSHFGIGGPSSSKVVAPAPMILLKNIGDRTSFFLLNVTDEHPGPTPTLGIARQRCRLRLWPRRNFSFWCWHQNRRNNFYHSQCHKLHLQRSYKAAPPSQYHHLICLHPQWPT